MFNSSLFVPVPESGQFYTLNEEAVPMLVHVYMRQDDEGRFRMFKVFGSTAKYSLPESVLIAECMLALITGGSAAFDSFVTREFERATAEIIEFELGELFPD